MIMKIEKARSGDRTDMPTRKVEALARLSRAIGYFLLSIAIAVWAFIGFKWGAATLMVLLFGHVIRSVIAVVRIPGASDDGDDDDDGKTS